MVFIFGISFIIFGFSFIMFLLSGGNLHDQPQTQTKNNGLIDYGLINTLDYYNNNRRGFKISSQDPRMSEPPDFLR